MAKDKPRLDENGNPVNTGMDFSHLKSVSEILNPRDAGEIIFKLEDCANRPFVIAEASIEAGTFGSYAKLVLYDMATQEEKTVTSGATLIMTQVSALINTNSIPCKVTIRKMGKTWTLN